VGEICLSLPQPCALLLSLLAFGHVHSGADLFGDFAGLIHGGASNRVQVPDRSVGANDSIIQFGVCVPDPI
jgi:hypothetical protein